MYIKNIQRIDFAIQTSKFGLIKILWVVRIMLKETGALLMANMEPIGMKNGEVSKKIVEMD